MRVAGWTTMFERREIAHHESQLAYERRQERHALYAHVIPKCHNFQPSSILGILWHGHGGSQTSRLHALPERVVTRMSRVKCACGCGDGLFVSCKDGERGVSVCAQSTTVLHRYPPQSIPPPTLSPAPSSSSTHSLPPFPLPQATPPPSGLPPPKPCAEPMPSPNGVGAGGRDECATAVGARRRGRRPVPEAGLDWKESQPKMLCAQADGAQAHSLEQARAGADTPRAHTADSRTPPRAGPLIWRPPETSPIPSAKFHFRERFWAISCPHHLIFQSPDW